MSAKIQLQFNKDYYLSLIRSEINLAVVLSKALNPQNSLEDVLKKVILHSSILAQQQSIPISALLCEIMQCN